MSKNDNNLHWERLFICHEIIKNSGSKGIALPILLKKLNSKLHDIGYKSIADRTVRDIVKDLKDHHAPLICQKKYYFYTENFELKHPITSTEIEHLQNIQSYLASYSYLPQYAVIAAMLSDIEGMQNNQPNAHLSIDTNINSKSNDGVNELLNYIKEENQITLVYKKFDKTTQQDITVSPLHLRNYNNRWFLIAWEESTQKLIHYGLDRIKKIKESAKTIPISTQAKEAVLQKFGSPYFNPQLYFQDVIGVTIHENAPVETIYFLVDSSIAAYFRTKPIHTTQKEHKKTPSDDKIEFSIHVKYNKELVANLLYWGSSVTITSPAHVVNKIKEITTQMIANYNF